MTEFRYTCSLGNYCFSAALIDMLKVRDRALPFIVCWSFIPITWVLF